MSHVIQFLALTKRSNWFGVSIRGEIKRIYIYIYIYTFNLGSSK
jgi:hypothetical protein